MARRALNETIVAQKAIYPKIAAGREYIDELRALGFEVSIAAWLYAKADREARLVIVSAAASYIESVDIYNLLFKAYDASIMPRAIDPFLVDLHAPRTWLARKLASELTRSFREGVIWRDEAGQWTSRKGGVLHLAYADDLSYVPTAVTIERSRDVYSMASAGLIYYDESEGPPLGAAQWRIFHNNVSSRLAA